MEIKKIYLRSLSAEVPAYPLLPKNIRQPEIDIQVDTAGQDCGQDLYEATVTMTVRATQEGKHLFLVVLVQGGLFHIQGVHKHDIAHMLEHACATMLFPYARKNMASTILSAGFQPILLNHMNFDAAWQTHASKQAAAETKTPPAPAAPAKPDSDRDSATQPDANVPANVPASTPSTRPSRSRSKVRTTWLVPLLGAVSATAGALALAYWLTAAPEPAPLPPVAVTPSPQPPIPPPVTLSPARQALAAAGRAWLAEQNGFVVAIGPLKDTAAIDRMQDTRTAWPLHLVQGAGTSTPVWVLGGAWSDQAAAESARNSLGEVGNILPAATLREQLNRPE